MSNKTANKRIVIFSTAYLPLIGGAELAVKEITDRLKDFEFDLVCARIAKNLPKTNVWATSMSAASVSGAFWINIFCRFAAV